MKTYCFRIYHRSIDSDDLVYIGANSSREAISLFKKKYGGIDFDFLGEE